MNSRASGAEGGGLELWLDTNVVFRFLLGDDDAHSPEAARLFKRAAAGEVTLKLSLAVVMECCETLRHVMKLGKAPIAEALCGVMALKGVRTEERDILERALAVYGRHSRVDFVDAYLAQVALTKGPPHVATFNLRDFNAPGLTARRPDAW